MLSRSPVTIAVPDGSVEIETLKHGRNAVRFTALDPAARVPRSEIESGFPIDLLSNLVSTSGALGVDEIARHEDPEYVLAAITRQIDGYFDRKAFAGKRLLDFGCGSGASTFGLAEMLPDTEVIGAELDEGKILTARLIAQHRRFSNAKFYQSTSGSELPAGIGQFDFVMLSAVWEHLLPAERPVITRLLWDALRPGGALLLNQTPYRWSPFEHHTTGLWGINYLPDSLASYFARNHARETPAQLAQCDWPQLLRRGIRGGTEWEVLGNIRRAGGRPTLMQPRAPYLDRADYWFRALSPKLRLAKRGLAKVFRFTDKVAGSMPVTHLDMVIRKD